MARRRLVSKGEISKGKGEFTATMKRRTPLVDFHKFPELPLELRMMIIEEALHEDQKRRPARLVLFDHHTYRISPLLEQSENLPPMLFVDTHFRKAALSIYVMLEVIEIGVPSLGQFGDEDDFFNENGDLEYNLDIAKQIDGEGDGNGKFCERPKGCVYIRPGTDIFLTGLVPRQVCNTEVFSTLIDAGPEGVWYAPVGYVTERLPPAACAQISTMRDLRWDPGCPNCGEYHPVHCRECFLEGRGQQMVDPNYDETVYSGVKEFGVYVMGGDNIPETLVYLLAVEKRATRQFLYDMVDQYLQGFPVPA